MCLRKPVTVSKAEKDDEQIKAVKKTVKAMHTLQFGRDAYKYIGKERHIICPDMEKTSTSAEMDATKDDM